MTAAGHTFDVELLEPEAFSGVQVAIGSTPDEVAAEFVPWAVERGTVVVDESGFFRMDPTVPLVIPEVNPEALDKVAEGNGELSRQWGELYRRYLVEPLDWRMEF